MFTRPMGSNPWGLFKVGQLVLTHIDMQLYLLVCIFVIIFEDSKKKKKKNWRIIEVMT